MSTATSASPASSPSGSASSTTQLVIPASAPAGLITVTQPPVTATSYYKIAPSNLITFGWNFSYVIATPTHLTVQAICDNGNTYPVGPTNGIIPGTATQVVWDIYSYQQANPNTPLAEETYTLNIWDDRGPGAGRVPGYLQPYSGTEFAMYSPEAYTPLASGWQCIACSGAWSSYTANPVFVSLCATFLVMFLSGFGLLRHWRQ
ncbi:hypothetical protein H0H92_002421 [Tricholoma furcatifolium]|nr:hypothetical protein H0H92_002421 [Tricholoma furcatifolium]